MCLLEPHLKLTEHRSEVIYTCAVNGISFRNSLTIFSSDFAKQSKVLLINRLPDTDDSRFQCFRWQLPEECLIEYREVDISSGLLSEEELMMTRGDSQYQQDLAEGGEPGPQDAADSDSESEHDVHDMTEGDYELSPREDNGNFKFVSHPTLLSE